MACCGSGLQRCTCRVVAGENIVIDGTGSPSSPYTVSAAVTTGCGLAGDGSAGAPLRAVTGAWPYPCGAEAYGGGVYCDSAGMLRSDPRPLTDYVQSQVNQAYPSTAVPSALDTVIETRTLSVTNPDPCREAMVLVEAELDVDFDLPASSGAAAGITTDEMQYFANRGTSTALDVHCQVTKVTRQTIPAGGTISIPLEVTMGRGSGGATYNRIQSFIRAFVFVL